MLIDFDMFLNKDEKHKESHFFMDVYSICLTKIIKILEML